MQTFTGYQYLLIDTANQFGLDKETFDKRIQWVTTNIDTLESLKDQADEPYLYAKAVSAVRKAQAKQPTGHLVAMDAVCSGIQLMSAMTGCIDGARATGLVDPDVRADAYTELTSRMQQELGTAFDVPRADAKQALMTGFYGSKAKPEEIFGKDTAAYKAFYKAGQEMAPGAFELIEDLRDSWQPYALVHEWKLPDGYDARVKVMQKESCRIEVDELDHASFTYEYYINQGEKNGLSNIANVVHSVDAFVLREMVRRCNYDYQQVKYLDHCIETELLERNVYGERKDLKPLKDEHHYYIEQAMRSGMASAVILDHLNSETIKDVPTELLHQLKSITATMQEYKPFPVITIHDSFAAHANNVNWVRHWYKELLAELADSDILSDILSQLHGTAGTYPKLSNNLSQYIRNSNYSLS